MWKKMNCRIGRALPIVVTLLAALVSLDGLSPRPAEGQAITSYLVGYLDGDETSLGLVGAQIAPARLGWRPVGSLEAFLLGYEQGSGERATLWSVAPGIGMQYQGVSGAFSARGSYQFITDEDAGARFFSGGESGVAATVQAQYWGSTPAVEALATHNFASSFLYSQVQAYLPVIAAPPGSIDVGAEYVWQGDFDDADTRSQMIGPLIRWATGTGVFAVLSGGLKNNLGPSDNTWYGRAALVFAP